MYPTTYNSLNHYNKHKPGIIQGPKILPPFHPTFMKIQFPLYPMPLNNGPGYNSLVYNGTGSAYYRVNEGPYGALKNRFCATNLARLCTGGNPQMPQIRSVRPLPQDSLRENYHDHEKVDSGCANTRPCPQGLERVSTCAAPGTRWCSCTGSMPTPRGSTWPPALSISTSPPPYPSLSKC